MRQYLGKIKRAILLPENTKTAVHPKPMVALFSYAFSLSTLGKVVKRGWPGNETWRKNTTIYRATASRRKPR